MLVELPVAAAAAQAADAAAASKKVSAMFSDLFQF